MASKQGQRQLTWGRCSYQLNPSGALNGKVSSCRQDNRKSGKCPIRVRCLRRQLCNPTTLTCKMVQYIAVAAQYHFDPYFSAVVIYHPTRTSSEGFLYFTVCLSYPTSPGRGKPQVSLHDKRNYGVHTRESIVLSSTIAAVLEYTRVAMAPHTSCPAAVPTTNHLTKKKKKKGTEQPEALRQASGANIVASAFFLYEENQISPFLHRHSSWSLLPAISVLLCLLLVFCVNLPLLLNVIAFHQSSIVLNVTFSPILLRIYCNHGYSVSIYLPSWPSILDAPCSIRLKRPGQLS